MSSAALVGQEAKHQILKQATRVSEGDVGAMGGVGGLLQKDAISGYFADVDRDGEALACRLLALDLEKVLCSRKEVLQTIADLTSEYGVHDWNVLVRQIARDGEDQDARVQGCWLDRIWVRGREKRIGVCF